MARAKGEELDIHEILIRSVYMRLYHSSVETPDDPYPMPVDDAERAALLVARGHAIEVAPNSYAMTDAGKYAWAEMNRHLLKAGVVNAWSRTLCDILNVKPAGTMTPVTAEALSALSDAPCLPGAFHQRTTDTLIEHEWAVRQGKRLHITDRGREALSRWANRTQRTKKRTCTPGPRMHLQRGVK